ncbi:cytochrome P450 [Rhodoplanes sp. TEM]|uniref:Cytochrome P450 n=1 Tax=Rhodoplanes tepidamans TaxID=200616 RepID=A0ABT5J5U9_RHOTP|nr:MULTISPECIES: cytochrome P450 [Rhodoplanes]MDC7785019.1 cytochrome P450 [Rhodoplanes tepidamans]MDC7982493.1 cytochrome P450 [Rhodoplanes sp. TEM]MDQ0356507.1 cytochrome P450 [Rhodoplanes tepidamans]
MLQHATSRPPQADAAPTMASLADTLAVLADVVIPTLGKGVIIRRPRVVGAAEALGLDDRAVRRMQRLRATYGTGLLRLAIPIRRHVLVLSPHDVVAILNGAPEPFSPATAEKRSALAHMEPDVSLISEGAERGVRRRFNEQVLETGCPVHRLAGAFLRAIDEETGALLAQAGGTLTWGAFTAMWQRLVRRIVLGEGAADDGELTDMLARLRGAANWAFLHPGRSRLRRRFHARLDGHLARAAPDSLAGMIAAIPAAAAAAPADQTTQYLFAFDAGAIATMRALALLAAHPAEMRRVQDEIAAAGPDGRADLPRGRAVVLESLRLWPTTPAILRETTRDVALAGTVLPKNTSLLIFAPYFHRDDETLSWAHRFTPDLWLADAPGDGWPLMPFSGGPAVCPAVRLVPMVASAVIATILTRGAVALADPARLDPLRLPGTLDYNTLRFRLG